MRTPNRTEPLVTSKRSHQAQRGLFGLHVGGLATAIVVALSFTATAGSGLETSTDRAGLDARTDAEFRAASTTSEQTSPGTATSDVTDASGDVPTPTAVVTRGSETSGTASPASSATQTGATNQASPSTTAANAAAPIATRPSSTNPTTTNPNNPNTSQSDNVTQHSVTQPSTTKPSTTGVPATNQAAPATTIIPSTTTSASKSLAPTTSTSTAASPGRRSSSPATVLLDSSPIGNVGFGSMTKTDITNMFGIAPDWLTHGDTLAITDGAIRHRYVPGSTGTAPVSFAIPVAETDSATMRYQVKFEPGWEWIHGGKLPGLAGGSMPSGGKGRNDGFSSRFMWRADGELVVYNYRPGIPGPWGEDVHVMEPLPIGQWVEIEQTITMNTLGSSNGALQVRVNGELVLARTDMVWRVQADVTIDHLLYSSFYGGGDPTWAPSKTTYAQFRNFSVTAS